MKLPSQDIDKIKKLFENLLNAKLEVKDNQDKNEQLLYITLIEYLDESLIIEQTTLDIAGIDLSTITSPLWDVIITFLDITYGPEITAVTIWYLFERHTIFEDKVSTEYEDFEGNIIPINNIEDLWLYVKDLLS
jgi:hypothetical protein